jgi:tetratricopeptide (TPR) repeat protein
MGSGYSQFSQGEYKAAISYFDKAIKLDPKNIAAYHERGLAKARLQRFEAAITDYDKAIEIDPQAAVIYGNRGIAKAHLKRFRVAIADYNKALKLDSENVQIYCHRGMAKASLRQFRAAITDYNTAIAYNSEYALAYCNRGMARANLKQSEAALADFNQAINIDPKWTPVYCERGITKANLKQFAEAITDFDKAITVDPYNANAYYHRGTAQLALGEKHKAKDDFMRLIPLSREAPQDSLYKYSPVNAQRLLSLINSEVYFAQHTKLNDPLECFFLNQSHLSMGECFRQFDIETRICTMTIDPESILMYAHYANEHKGICVEYELNFRALKNQHDVAYGYVSYEQKQQITNLKDLYMLKNSAWQYEKEFRIVRFGKRVCEQARIKSITFGLRCPLAYRQIIYHLMPECLDYYEMVHQGQANMVTRNPVDKPEQHLSLDAEQIFKLMLANDLAHLYFYALQKAEAIA